MANFLIEIAYLHPYPIKCEYRKEASSIAPAVSRAIKDWRKDKGKAIKVKTITIKATKI